MQILIYYPGFYNTSVPLAGTSRILFYLAKMLAEQHDVVIGSEALEYTERVYNVLLFPFKEAITNDKIATYDLVVFACGKCANTLKKPERQKWIRMQHCWDFPLDEMSGNFDLITGVSTKHIQHLQTIGIPASKLRCIPNFINLAKYTKKNVRRDKYSIMFVGAISANKGLHIMLDAVKFLAAVGIDVKVEIYGSAKMTNSPALYEREIIKKAIGFDVLFCGEADSDTLSLAYSRNSILCLPSDIESFGLVLAEAQACGCIPVVHDSGGVSAVVDDGKTGYLYKPNDAMTLYRTLRKVLKDGITNEMRMNAIEFARKKFNDKGFVRSVNSIMRELFN